MLPSLCFSPFHSLLCSTHLVQALFIFPHAFSLFVQKSSVQLVLNRTALYLLTSLIPHLFSIQTKAENYPLLCINLFSTYSSAFITLNFNLIAL